MGRRAQVLMSEARKALSSAYAEYEDAKRSGDAVKLRKACEAGWLAVIKVTDSLLEAYGLGAGRSHRDRRVKLRDLESSRPAVKRLGLRDRYMARMGYLHIEGFYEGTLDPDEVKEQLEKVEVFMDDTEEVIKSLIDM